MQICPRCNIKLRKAVLDGMFVWDCPLCSGRAVSIEVVRKLVPLATVKELWNHAVSSTLSSEARCPVCTKSMRAIALNISTSGTELDICTGCRFIWFDRYEFQRLPAQLQTPPERTLSLEARKAVALAKIEAMRESRDQTIADDGPPDTWWQFGLGVLGIPWNMELMTSGMSPSSPGG